MKYEPLVPGRKPLVVVPEGGATDLPLWCAQHRDWIRKAVLDHGGLLLRGFDACGAHDLERFTVLVTEGWMGYRDRASKRSPVAGNIFTSTDTPAGYSIQLHCESTFTSRWPRHIIFHCTQPAADGGSTPIADVRAVHDRISAEVRAPFEELGILYVRNFGYGPGMDWRDTFQVADEHELEEYAHAAGITLEWVDGGKLRTSQRRPAVVTHPTTGELCWFNHAAVLHYTALETGLRETLLRQNGEQNLPHNTYYGDGSPIEPAAMQKIRDAYEQETMRFTWQRGDILMLDNMSMAHGRDPFAGDREVLVAMADPTTWSEVEHSAVVSSPPRNRVTDDAVSQVAAATVTDASGERAPTTVDAGMTALFVDVLELDDLDLDADWIVLGGDSVSAARLVTRVEELWGVDLPMEAIFDAVSLRALTAVVAGMRSQGNASDC